MNVTCIGSTDALVELTAQAISAPFDFLIVNAEMRRGDSNFGKLLNPSAKIIELVKSGTSADRSTAETSCEMTRLIMPATRTELIRAMTTCDQGDKTQTATQIKSHATLKPLRVLLADDGATNQVLAKAILESENHKVDIASTGREAVSATENNDFDLILMDIQMPELDGLDATREIRRREITLGRHTPIIAMTAAAMPEDKAKCFEAGMDGYLTKPLRAESLRDLIISVLRSAVVG